MMTDSISQNPSREDYQIRFFFLFVLLIPVWWIIGLNWLIFQLFTFFLLIDFVQRQKRSPIPIKLPVQFIFLVLFIVLYGVSILVNIRNIPPSRILASFNNLSFWMMGFILLFVLDRTFRWEGIKKIILSVHILGFFSSLFCIFGLVLWLFTNKFYQFESVLAGFLPKSFLEMLYSRAHILYSSLVHTVVGRDRLFDAYVPRVVGFHVYATAFAMASVIFMTMTLIYFLLNKKQKWILIVLVLECIAFVFSFSRTAILGIILAGSVVCFLAYHNRKWMRVAVIVCLIAALLFIVVVSPSKMIETASGFRKGSTFWRARLYSITVEQALKKPILGWGFKPKTEEFQMPIGSHSTYLGVFYRTGCVGFFVFCLFWYYVVKRWWELRKTFILNKGTTYVWIITGTALITGLLWMLTDDLDAPPLTAFLYFILIGIIFGLQKLKNQADSLAQIQTDLNP